MDVPLDELAEILGELELPKIEPRGLDKIQSTRDRYVGIRSVGPETLRHFRRTYKQALYDRSQVVRTMLSPIVVPRREDKRYRSWRTENLRSLMQ